MLKNHWVLKLISKIWTTEKTEIVLSNSKCLGRLSQRQPLKLKKPDFSKMLKIVSQFSKYLKNKSKIIFVKFKDIFLISKIKLELSSSGEYPFNSFNLIM